MTERALYGATFAAGVVTAVLGGLILGAVGVPPAPAPGSWPNSSSLGGPSFSPHAAPARPHVDGRPELVFADRARQVRAVHPVGPIAPDATGARQLAGAPALELRSDAPRPEPASRRAAAVPSTSAALLVSRQAVTEARPRLPSTLIADRPAGVAGVTGDAIAQALNASLVVTSDRPTAGAAAGSDLLRAVTPSAPKWRRAPVEQARPTQALRIEPDASARASVGEVPNRDEPVRPLPLGAPPLLRMPAAASPSADPAAHERPYTGPENPAAHVDREAPDRVQDDRGAAQASIEPSRDPSRSTAHGRPAQRPRVTQSETRPRHRSRVAVLYGAPIRGPLYSGPVLIRIHGGRGSRVRTTRIRLYRW